MKKEFTWEKMLQLLWYKECRRYPGLERERGTFPTVKSKVKVSILNLKWRKRK